MQVALGILKRTGYSEVTTVVDGQQAMDELHRRGGADAFDIILTDLHMPHKVCCATCACASITHLQCCSMYVCGLPVTHVFSTFATTHVCCNMYICGSCY